MSVGGAVVLRLPFEALRTVYAGACEVRLYRNEVTGSHEVGKRVSTHGLEGALIVQEASWLQRIRHDNVVPVQSVAVVDGYPAALRVVEMVMPYYPRGSVADALARGERFGVRDARDVALAALNGLAELHERERVLHRDFKSPNLLLTEDRVLARVGDLGAAAAMDASGRAPAYPSAQLYSPPEAFSTHEVDRSSDLYAAGLVLLELANGRLPWEEYGDRLAMARRLSAGRPAVLPRHLRVGPHVPPRMRAIITKATAASPGRRYATAAEMAAALSACPLVDWAPDREEGGARVWEGRSAVRPDRRYRVEAHRLRRGGWRLAGLQHVRAWRRAVRDQDVDALDSTAAREFFDQIVVIAVSR